VADQTWTWPKHVRSALHTPLWSCCAPSVSGLGPVRVTSSGGCRLPDGGKAGVVPARPGRIERTALAAEPGRVRVKSCNEGICDGNAGTGLYGSSAPLVGSGPPSQCDWDAGGLAVANPDATQRSPNSGIVAELEAMALGGLGDAEYVRGRMISAYDRFRECVELSERHGFGRIEVANRPMMAFTQWFAGDTRGALAVADAAIDRAARVGHRRAEMVGHHAAFFCRHALMDFEGACRDAEAALTLAQQLGARRFETEALVFQAELHRLAGRRAEALANAEEAVKISRDTSIAFLGPFALGALSLASDNPTARQAALEEAEELLRAGAVSHNHLLFPRDAIEVYLEADNWDCVERAVAELEHYTRSEPLPFADFYIARGRALAACGRGQSDMAELAAELERIHDEGERLGIRVALRGTETAISQLRR